MTPNELLYTEQEYVFIVPLPDAARILNGRVDKYSTIVIDQNRYSVPDYLVGEVVRMKVYSDSIQCFITKKNRNSLP